MQTTFFTSDQHFSHFNIIKYCNRPFSSTEEMDEHMIEKWNSVVKKGDIVYHLGDFQITGYSKKHVDVVSKTLRRLNGNKILISGNHDSPAVLSAPEWSKVYRLHHINVNDQRIILCHYPMRSWQFRGHGAWQLFGHCHNNMQIPDNEYSCDVGVDVPAWGFTPVSFEQLKEKFSTIKWDKESNLV